MTDGAGEFHLEHYSPNSASASCWRIRHSFALMKRLVIAFLLIGLPAAAAPVPYQNPDLPVPVRVADLVSRLTLEEKVSLMMMDSPAVPRLGIPGYHWWNEGLHGYARSGLATVFPQAIGLAATWDPELLQQIGDVVSTEARAKYNEALRKSGHTDIYQGITIWSPNINIFRDPRWGRGQETYGEDPFLTGTMAVAFVTGIQGQDQHYLKAVATLKHFAVHSGPESLRHVFDANADPKDLHETYLTAFEMGVTRAHAYSVMSAYNSVLGVPAPANTLLLRNILRSSWGFDGAVVGDVDAVSDVFEKHHFAQDAAHAAALSVLAGTDLCSGVTYRALPEAVRLGLLGERDIDRSLSRLLVLRFRLGQFDPAYLVPFSSLSARDIASRTSRTLALRAASEAMVLLKNDGVLPLSLRGIKTVALIGPVANDPSALLGNYCGTPAARITLADALRAKFGAYGITVEALAGSPLVQGRTAELLNAAMAAARAADVVILSLGITPDLEGEEMQVDLPGFNGGDRTSIALPTVQQALLANVAALRKPTVIILTAGSAVALDPAKANAILCSWYYGERGAEAVADILVGDINPSGHLPVTFYAKDTDLPPFTDYSMAGRTYRYFKGTPLWAFGHGLSYTRFAVTPERISRNPMDAAGKNTLQVRVKNTGRVAGDAVVQAYLVDSGSPGQTAEPLKRLIAFQRVSLNGGETREVALRFSWREIARWDPSLNAFRTDPGSYAVRVGQSSDNLSAPIAFTVR